METQNDDSSTSQPIRPRPIDWGTIAIRAWIIVAVAVGVVLLIKLGRRGGGGLALAIAAPAVAAASARRKTKDRHEEPKEIDQDFLKLWLVRLAVHEPLNTPSDLCEVLNNLFRNEGRDIPFESPAHMARELKKLGLQSSVRSVPGRSERRWYDLTGYGTHETSA